MAQVTWMLLVAGCSSSRGTTASDPAVHPQARDSTAFEAALGNVMRAARRSAAAWPGFDLQQHVLVATLLSDSLTYLIGDSSPPAGYAPSAVLQGVHVRRGLPPDSLLGLRVAMTWKDRAAAATALSFSGTTAPHAADFLIHEAFHTHQSRQFARDGSRFQQADPPSFPVTSHAALAAVNLEGHYLAGAFVEANDEQARELARHAVAIRRHRCTIVGPEECTSERGVEQNEGTATYVTAVLLGEAIGYGPSGVWQGAVAQAIAPVSDLQRLERWHFYDTGHLWLRLIDRFTAEMPYDQLERTPPDVVLGAILGVDDAAAPRLVAAALSGPHAPLADAAARRALEREAERRTEQTMAFLQQPGVPIRVYFGAIKSMRTESGPLPDGRTSLTRRFGANTVVFRGQSREFCCPLGGWTITEVVGKNAQVNDVVVPLDRPGTATGALTLQLDGVSIDMPHAVIDIYPDSVTVKALEPDAR